MLLNAYGRGGMIIAVRAGSEIFAKAVTSKDVCGYL